MKLSAAIAITASSLLLGGQALAAPFGLNMGDSAAKLKASGIDLKHDGDFDYSTNSLPKGSDLLDYYSFTISPTYGLCVIAAGSYLLNISKYGTEYKDNFRALKNALQKNYGKSKDYDFLKAGAIWNSPSEYSMSIFKDERVLASFWSKRLGSTMKDNIYSISLDTKGAGSDYGTVIVKYEYSNAEKCRQEESAIDASSF